MKIGFDNREVSRSCSRNTSRSAIAQFGGKLYLEFGGKLFDDYPCFPGTARLCQPDSKMKMLLQLRDQAEIVIAINAGDIEKNKVRGDLGITYDLDVLRLIDAFRSIGLYVGSVVITQYAGSGTPPMPSKRRLEALGVPVLPALSHRRLSCQYPADRQR